MVLNWTLLFILPMQLGNKDSPSSVLGKSFTFGKTLKLADAKVYGYFLQIRAEQAKMKPKGVAPSTPLSCFKMAKECATGEARDKNIVWSPCSIQLAFGLLANGSTGSTRKELLTFLEAETLDDLNSRNEKLLESFGGEEIGDPIISFVGCIWAAQWLGLKPSYKEIAAKIYRGKVEHVDFENEAKEMVDKVNQWAEEATNGLITNFLPPGYFTPLTNICLANALYFKGRWLKVFDDTATKDDKFYLINGDSVQVPYMTSRCDRQIASYDEFKILKLGYCSESSKWISMYIILPNKRDGLFPLIEMVSSDSLFFKERISRQMDYVLVGEFKVPKLKVTYQFEPSEVLKAVGLQKCFSEDAEFDDMYECGFFEISNVNHKACIEIDEEGTEAAAVDEDDDFCLFDDEPPKPRTPVDFVADHPFMFLIRDDKSGAVLFMGHVVNPILD